MSVERIIGVDFGTSTSVMRIKRYKNGAAIGDRLETKAVTFNMGSTMVPTLVQKLSNGESAYFGNNAEIPHKGASIYSNFKVQLEDTDEYARKLARELTAEYFGYLAKAYKTQSEGGHFGENSDQETTIISYPVKWSEETRRFMLEIAKAAGFPNVEGMDEAQAAIAAVTVQNADMLSKKGYFTANTPVNILLLDMGAGTSDLVLCRHTPGTEPKTEILCTWPQNGSALFGGREVDEMLKQYILSKVPEDTATIVSKKLDSEKYKAWKETVVSPALLKNETVDYFAALDDLLDLLDSEADYTLNRDSFEQFARDYLCQLPNLVNDCLREGGMDGTDVDLLILTGGHSQWYFPREILSAGLNRFGEVKLSKIAADPGRIIPITRPQETVALGLVYSKMKVQEDELLTYLAEKNASCSKDGSKACWVRNSDNALFADEQAQHPLTPNDVRVPALGHQYKWREKNGERIHICTRCGYIDKREALPANEALPAAPAIQTEDITVVDLEHPTPETQFELYSIGEHYGIKKYLGKDSIVAIPSKIRGRKVIAIGDSAFNSLHTILTGNKRITTIYIPETVKEIGNYAFWCCTNLQTVIAHNKIEVIGTYAFNNCINLTTMDFHTESCVPYVVTFPPTLKSIGIGAFLHGSKCVFREVHLSKTTKLKSTIGLEKTFSPKICAMFYYD